MSSDFNVKRLDDKYGVRLYVLYDKRRGER